MTITQERLQELIARASMAESMEIDKDHIDEYREILRDARRFRYLANLKCNNFILGVNDIQRPNYISAKEYIECYQFAGEIIGDPKEIVKMKETDNIVSLQIYPDTPIGFYTFYGASIEYVIDEAIAHED